MDEKKLATILEALADKIENQELAIFTKEEGLKGLKEENERLKKENESLKYDNTVLRKTVVAYDSHWTREETNNA